MTNTAAEVLDECRRLGITLAPTNTGVKCTAPKGTMTPALAAVVKAHRDEIRQLLAAEIERMDDSSTAQCSSRGGERTGEVASWPDDVGALADFVLLLTAEDLPAAPFAFRQYSTVVDAEKFLRLLHADIRAGPPGQRRGSLHDDLCRVRALLLDQPA